MKPLAKKTTTWLISLLALSLTYGAQATDGTDGQKSTASSTDSNRSDTKDSRASEGMPAKVNKASSLIGMEVRNQNNEHLGHIKDLVFDLKSERVSYAVLTTSSKATLGLNDKLIAIPLSALTASGDEKHLVLNAEKSKVEAAAGFEHNNWPMVNNPSWGGEPFWQSDSQQNNQNYQNNQGNQNNSSTDKSRAKSDAEQNPVHQSDAQPKNQ